MERKKSNEEKPLDFEKIDKIDALNQMKVDIRHFLAAMVKMKMVDNFDHAIPSGLASFSKFFFKYYDLIYQHQDLPEKIYMVFLDWLNNENLF